MIFSIPANINIYHDASIPLPYGSMKIKYPGDAQIQVRFT